MLNFIISMPLTTTEATQPVTTQSLELMDLVMKGGFLMIPLALLSFIAVFIFFERYLAIKKASKIDINFIQKVKELVSDGKLETAIRMCKKQNTSISRIIEKGLMRMGRPIEEVHRTIENAGDVEIMKLESGLPFLATISGGAPMIGFLGTVIGMVQAFMDMANAGGGIDITLLSSGIYTAMITTVAGLSVGIPTYFGYNYLISRVERVIFQMETNTMEFLDFLTEPVQD